MNTSTILKAALAASMATAGASALAADHGLVTPQEMKVIARANCAAYPHSSQDAYGVRPGGNSWMLNLDEKYSDPPDAKTPCAGLPAETYGVLPHGQSWMVDYERK